MTAVVIFSFLVGLSMVGSTSIVAGSTMSGSQIGGGGQELEEGEQQRRLQMCGTSEGVADGTNANTTTATTGIDGGGNNNNTSLYQNLEYGIQVLCPEGWIYSEEENRFTGEFQVYFTSPTEVIESQRTGEIPPTVSVMISEAPIPDIDLEVFADLNIRDIRSRGYEIISTSLNTTLSGMPAFEVVYVDTNGTMTLNDWAIQGDRAYGVVYVSSESKFNQFLPIVQEMISSLTITNNNSGTTTDAPLTDDNNNGNGTAPMMGTVQDEQQRQKQQEVEWLQYENATYGVRMLYPSDWTYYGNPVGEDDRFIFVSHFFPPEDAVDSHATALIAIDNAPQSTNIEQYLNESIDSFMQDPNLRDFQVLSSSTDDFTLAGVPAYSFEATYLDPEFGPQHMLEVGTIIGNQGYFMQYFADPTVYQQYFPIVERMIESFEIMQQLQQQEDGQEEGGQQQLQQPPQQDQGDSFSAIPELF